MTRHCVECFAPGQVRFRGVWYCLKCSPVVPFDMIMQRDGFWSLSWHESMRHHGPKWCAACQLTPGLVYQ